MADQKYNGWTNYETWCVNLWLTNDSSGYDAATEVAQEAWDEAEEDRRYPSQTRKEAATCILADRLKAEHEDAQEDYESEHRACVFTDLLNAAMSEVNWYEIAESLLEEYEEEEAKQA